MTSILDSTSGETHKAIIEAMQHAHRTLFAARDEVKEGRVMFHELAKEEKFRKEFVHAVKSKLSKDVVRDEEESLRHIENLTKSLKHSLMDNVMIAHLVIQALVEFIHDDQKIQQEGFSHETATKLIAECEKQMDGIKRVLFDYSNVLRQESTEGGN